MSTLKRYKFEHPSMFVMVVLEVDTSKLTAERATEILTFWGNHEHRLNNAGGNAVIAVARAFASYLADSMLRDSGVEFSSIPESAQIAQRWSVDQRGEEGWGGEDGTPHGWCGIRVVEAQVALPDEDDYWMDEVQS